MKKEEIYKHKEYKEEFQISFGKSSNGVKYFEFLDDSDDIVYREFESGYWVKREYDEFGNVVKSETSEGGYDEYIYDRNNKVVFVKLKNGNVVDLINLEEFKRLEAEEE